MSSPGPSGDVVLRGVVVIPPDHPDEAAALTVFVEDTSRADALASPVGEQRMEQLRLPPGSNEVSFSVTIPRGVIDPSARYSVRAHVDISGSGDISGGDLISTQYVPVLTQDAPQRVVVPVQRI